MSNILLKSAELAQESLTRGSNLPAVNGTFAPTCTSSLDGETFTTIIVPEVGFVNLLHVGHGRRCPSLH
jgi:hypothetical protein